MPNSVELGTPASRVGPHARPGAGLGKAWAGDPPWSERTTPGVLVSSAAVFVAPGVHPGILVALAVTLILAQLLYAFWPHSERSFAAVLMLTAVGVLAGQGWQYVGLPGFGLGEANLFPAVLFAILLQPAAARLGRLLSRNKVRP